MCQTQQTHTQLSIKLCNTAEPIFQERVIFFTVNIAERNKSLLIDHIDELRGAFKKIKQNHPFIIEAIVILPDQIHTLWQLPEYDADFPTRWRLIKSAFSRALPQTERISTSRRKKGERGIWQRRY